MPAVSSRPYRMFLPLIIVLVLAALWSAYWFWAISLAKTQAAEQRLALAERGITLGCAREVWGGYPFRFEFTCDAPVLDVAGRAEAASGRLLLAALAYNPWQVVALVDGPTTVARNGSPPLVLDHQRVVAAFTVGKDHALSVSSEVPGLTVPGLGRVDKAMLHMRPSETGMIDIAVSVAGSSYQPDGRPPLEIDNGTLRATLQDDGKVRLDRIELQRGSVRYWGSGTMSLDTDRRMAGEIATETNDLDGLLALLDPHLEMTEEQKSNLRMVLGLLGNEAKAPIIARDGALLIGPFKIADLVPLY